MKNYPPKSKIALMIEEYWRKKNLENYYKDLNDCNKIDRNTSLQSSNTILNNEKNNTFRSIFSDKLYNPSKYSRFTTLKPIDERTTKEKKEKEEKEKKSKDFDDFYFNYLKRNKKKIKKKKKKRKKIIIKLLKKII